MYYSTDVYSEEGIEIYLFSSSLKIRFYVKAQNCALQISVLKFKVDPSLRNDCKPVPRKLCYHFAKGSASSEYSQCVFIEKWTKLSH